MTTTTHHQIAGPHCSSCGSTDPEDLRGGDGYTSCCNKSICGGGSYRYGTPEVNFRACCWGAAEQAFDAAGIEIPDGSYRLDI